MRQAIENFASQFAYQPKIENGSPSLGRTKFIVVGMGGSHLAADLLKIWDPYLDVIIHHDYGLPALSDQDLNERLVILSSYSGNTEEVLDALEKAREKNLKIIIITIGGKLLQLAKKYNLPYIQMPDTGIQPRSAMGFFCQALLKIIGAEEALKKTKELADSLKPSDSEKTGQALAERLQGFVPVIYSSLENLAIAYNWKIKFNETGKIPAFYNVFSELNHNEMSGFDVKDPTKPLSKNFYFLLLEDDDDNPKIKKRMQILAELYRQRGLTVESIKLTNNANVFYKIFSSLILTDWAAFYTAKLYGLEPEKVEMNEEFKKLIAD